MRPTGGPATAPSTPQTQTYGLVFSSCTITSASGVAAGSLTLMRPWGGREATCRAYEYGSKTPAGATINLATRASWCVRLSAAQAATYTKSNVLGGWTPS